MSAISFKQLESQLAQLSLPEKAEVVRLLTPHIVHTWPGIEKTPGVMGGDACLMQTRVAVWALENYRRLGWSEAQILENYPMLRAVDLVNAWSYAEAHRSEIEEALAAHETA